MVERLVRLNQRRGLRVQLPFVLKVNNDSEQNLVSAHLYTLLRRYPMPTRYCSNQTKRTYDSNLLYIGSIT